MPNWSLEQIFKANLKLEPGNQQTFESDIAENQ